MNTQPGDESPVLEGQTELPKMPGIVPAADAVSTGALLIQQEVWVANVSEPKSLVTEREVGNWCDACRKFKMPVVSFDNWAGVFLGTAIGLTVAAIAGDFTVHPRRQGAIAAGAILCWVLFVIFAGLSWRERSDTGHRLTTLANEMETACKAGKAREVPTTAGTPGA